MRLVVRALWLALMGILSAFRHNLFAQTTGVCICFVVSVHSSSFFFYDYYAILAGGSIRDTRYSFLGLHKSDHRRMGASHDRPIVLYHGLDGVASAFLSVGWSCRLPFSVALAHHTCGAHIASCLYCFLLSFYQTASAIGGVCAKVSACCMEVSGLISLFTTDRFPDYDSEYCELILS